MSRVRGVVAFVCGLVFAIGLGISGMTRPEKVLDFLDVAGRWDPSLVCVMGGALGVTALLFPRVLRRHRPLFDSEFHLQAKRAIDGRLLLGAGLFGIGWGIAGFCPGPAVVNLAAGADRTLVFVAAMVGAMWIFGLAESPRQKL